MVSCIHRRHGLAQHGFTLALLSVSLLGQTGAQAGSGVPTAVSSERPGAGYTDRLIIKYTSGSPPAHTPTDHNLAPVLAAGARAGVQMKWQRSTSGGAHVMQLDQALDTTGVRQLAQQVSGADAQIEYVEPDVRLVAQLSPTDSLYSQQWHYFESTAGINTPDAWNISTGKGVVVAVVDTGYRPHADLAANILPGYDFVSSTSMANDGNGRDSSAYDPGDAVSANECGYSHPAYSASWHGTHVAGTIAAVTNNSTGVAGVAHGAKVLPVRVLGKCGGYTSDIADGILWASGETVAGVGTNPNPAKVINLSLGGTASCSATMQNAITKARNRGSVVVVAAGNSATNVSTTMPANCTGVIAVASVGRGGARAYYSNYGSGVSLAAPGGDMSSSSADGVLSTFNSGSTNPGSDNYAWYQGTSMAAPHVSGVAALVLGLNSGLTPDQASHVLTSTASSFPASCSGCGSGIVNAYAAVTNTPAPTAVTAVQDSTQTISAMPVIIRGTLSSSSALSNFVVTVPAGTTLNARIPASSTVGYTLTLLSASGSTLATKTGGLNKITKISATNSGSTSTTWTVRVTYATGTLGTAYRLRLSY